MTRQFDEKVEDVRIFVKDANDVWYEATIPEPYKMDMCQAWEDLNVYSEPVDLTHINHENTDN